MDPLAVISELRTQVKSIENRIANYRRGPETFRTLSGNVDNLDKHVAEIETLLSSSPDALPTGISAIFRGTLAEVCAILQNALRTMEQTFSKVFSECGSSAMDRLRSKARRAFRAKYLSDKMGNLDAEIERASNKLLHLTSTLASALKIDGNLKNLSVVEKSVDKYSPWANAPALTGTVKLDFGAKDAEGNPSSPEGVLKDLVLSRDSSSSVTAAAGVMKSVYCITGMAGVGKTVALRGLAHDKYVRSRFPDGVIFMTLGQGATVQVVIRGLAKILSFTGGKSTAAVVGNCTSLLDAVDYTARWFQRRVCLFLVDDVWPISNCKTGFLTDLRQLLRESPESCMAISTRSVAIAQCAGATVRFGPGIHWEVRPRKYSWHMLPTGCLKTPLQKEAQKQEAAF